MSVPSHLTELYNMTNRGCLSELDNIMAECWYELEGSTDSELIEELAKEMQLVVQLKRHMQKMNGIKANTSDIALELAEQGDTKTAARLLEASDKL